MIYLQISTAQGPAECRIFARFVLKKLLAEAEARNVKAEIAGETADKHGILSAVLMLEERLPTRWRKLAGHAAMGVRQPRPSETSA